MKKFVLLVRKVIISSFILYGYNLIAVNFNLVLPINIFNVSVVSILGSCGLFGLVLFGYLFL